MLTGSIACTCNIVYQWALNRTKQLSGDNNNYCYIFSLFGQLQRYNKTQLQSCTRLRYGLGSTKFRNPKALGNASAILPSLRPLGF